MADCPDSNKSLNAAYPETGSSPIIYTGSGINSGVGAGIGTTAFDINKIAAAANEYMALNGLANQLFGIEARWFRAVPQHRSIDVIFQEYTLYNVDETPLCLKVIVPGGTIPDSKYDYDLMGLEYEIPLEIQIDKKYWESLAGFGTAPQKKDIVYLPMPNKLYQVESAYLYRGFMEQETTWKCNLRKYMPEASRKESAALQDTIDQYTTSVEEIFGEAIDDNVKKLVNDQQFSQYNATSEDKYKTLDTSVNAISTSITLYGTVLAQSFYDLNSAGTDYVVNYTTSDSISTIQDRCLVAWIYPRTIDNVNVERNVVSIIPATTPYTDASTLKVSNFDIRIISPDVYEAGDTFVIYRSDTINLYATVLNVKTNPVIYECLIDTDVLTHLQSIKSNWYVLPNYKMMRKAPISVLDGVNSSDEHIFSTNVYANQYIKVNYGTQEYVVTLTDKLYDDTWYGIIINIGNTWQQYNAYVWEKHETDKDTKIKIRQYETMQFTPEEALNISYRINKSPAYLTNMRLYDATLEEEYQRDELVSYFIKDAEHIIIADQCDATLRVPYVSKQK